MNAYLTRAEDIKKHLLNKLASKSNNDVIIEKKLEVEVKSDETNCPQNPITIIDADEEIKLN